MEIVDKEGKKIEQDPRGVPTKLNDIFGWMVENNIDEYTNGSITRFDHQKRVTSIENSTIIKRNSVEVLKEKNAQKTKDVAQKLQAEKNNSIGREQ